MEFFHGKMHTLPLEPSHDAGSVPKEIQLLVEERALAIAKAAELPAVKAEEKLDPWS